MKSDVKLAIPQKQELGNIKHTMCIVMTIDVINCKPLQLSS